jgi:hypothetical protein
VTYPNGEISIGQDVTAASLLQQRRISPDRPSRDCTIGRTIP